MIDRIPPSALEAEQAILGAMMVDATTVPIVTQSIGPDDFYNMAHIPIFKAIVDLNDKGQRADKISVSQLLKDRGLHEKTGGISYLSSLYDAVDTVYSAPFHAAIVREKSILRRLIAAGTRIVNLGFDGEDDVSQSVSDAERELFLAVRAGAKKSDGETASAIAEQQYKNFLSPSKRSQLTPWPTLNRYTGGFFPGEFIAWPAAPKAGKSALISQLADFVSSQGHGAVAYFPLEMGKEATVRRMLATYSGVQSRKQRLGELMPRDYDLLMASIDVLRSRNLHVFGRGKSVMDIRREAQRIASDGPLAAIIVDHPGFLSDVDEPGKSSKHERLDRVYRALLQIAEDTQSVMHVVQHLNRDGMTGEPSLRNIRDGGNIEGHSHIIVSPYRPNPTGTPEEQRDGKLIVLANRDGEAGAIDHMQFIGSRHLWLEQNQQLPIYLETGVAAA